MRAIAACVGSLGLVSALVLGGCSSPKTPESFCKVYHAEKAAYLEKNAAALKDVEGENDQGTAALKSLLALGTALGDIVVLMDKLAKAAPDDIEPDLRNIHDQLQKQLESAGDNIGNPLQGLGSSLASGLMTIGSWQRFDAYVRDNC
ncbi:hypothetical protein [Nostocoides jenkinsii]|uniref:hypothetical protein n=1 Tax=Nostocoides jenkinsii TaxID=330834 RepID=UPI00065B934F|nr:hypothetical protein [Tetrasphaera jenkinsii]